MRLARELRALRRADVGLLLRIVVLLAALSMALPFRKVGNLVQRLTPKGTPATHDLSDVQRVVRHVDGVLRRAPFLPYGYCLLRSLTLYYFCTRLGYPVRVSFGVRVKVEQGLDGHGWLTLHGRPFMERGDPEAGFVPIWRLPAEVAPCPSATRAGGGQSRDAGSSIS